MKKIEIGEKSYVLLTDFNELTLPQYCNLLKIQARKEKREDTKENRIITEENAEFVKEENESDEFILQKNADYLQVICDIPYHYLMQFEIQNALINLCDTILYSDNLEPLKHSALPIHKEKYGHYEFILDGDTYYIPTFQNMCFQQFADAENYSKQGIWNYIITLMQTSRKTKYNRYHPTWQDKKILIENTLAKDLLHLLMTIINEISIVKSKYTFLFGGEDIGEHSEALAAHSNLFGWEEVIATLAETNVFNGPKGTLDGVRNALALDVLDYLNLKKSKQIAEFKHNKLKNTKDSTDF